MPTATLILDRTMVRMRAMPGARRAAIASPEPVREPSVPEAPETGAETPADPASVPLVNREEAEWARRAALGDRGAFGRLYGRFAAMVHGILLGLLGPERAEDLVQEVFLKALKRVRELREPDHVGSWLAAIARNAGKDALRAARPERPLEDGQDPVENPPPRMEAIEVLRTVRDLPEAYRETLVLRLVEGMTGPEIAVRCGLTPGSVRVNLCRGMKLLLERLKERGWM